MKLLRIILSALGALTLLAIPIIAAVQGCESSQAVAEGGVISDGGIEDCKMPPSNWRVEILQDAAATDEEKMLSTFFDVWGASEQAIFVVGTKGRVVFYNGKDWQRQTTPTQENLTSVWGTSEADVWAVGYGGTVIHYNGTEWQDASPPTGMLAGIDGGVPAGDAGAELRKNLWSVWAAGADGTTEALYAVGEQGMILQMNNQKIWNANIPVTAGGQPAKVQDQLNGVWGESKDKVYIVGNFGSIFVGSAAGFTKQQTGTTKDLNGVWGRAGGDVYAVGNSGVILHQEGGAWKAIEGAPKQVLRSIWGPENDPSLVFISGWDGTIMAMTGGPGYTKGAVFHEYFCVVPRHRLEGIWGTTFDAGALPPDAGAPLLLDAAIIGEAGVVEKPDAGFVVRGVKCWIAGASGMVVSGP